MNVIIVTGGREYSHTQKVNSTLDNEKPNLIVVGDAIGADALAREWARKNCVPCLVFYADWTKYGRAAGPKRNEDMLLFVQENFGHEHTCKLVAFPGGNGTANCIERAHIINFNVLVITDER